MPVAGGGFDQAYNAQATWRAAACWWVANDVVQAANDKEQIARCWNKLDRLAAALASPRPCWRTAVISATRT